MLLTALYSLAWEAVVMPGVDWFTHVHDMLSLRNVSTDKKDMAEPVNYLIILWVHKNNAKKKKKKWNTILFFNHTNTKERKCSQKTDLLTLPTNISASFWKQKKNQHQRQTWQTKSITMTRNAHFLSSRLHCTSCTGPYQKKKARSITLSVILIIIHILLLV